MRSFTEFRKLFDHGDGEKENVMAKVGILYDNISGNTGDVAIGLSIKKILREIGVEFDELFPGNFNPDDYNTIIIGGGHLIRPSPDFFYDKFKVPGQHVLNAIGILDSPHDLHYLNEYKYITVRSSWDKKRLSYLKKDVHILPCTTMLLEDLEDIPVVPKETSLGIHLTPGIFNEGDEKIFVGWASSLPFNIYLLPITHYNQDYIYLSYLSSKIKNSVLLPLMNPLEIFTFIGKLDYFISCSLHGGIFSYKHNVPFILYNYNEKMYYFMKDRGLEKYTFTSINEMAISFERLLNEIPDYSDNISSDLDLLQKYIQHLKHILPASELVEEMPIQHTNLANYQIQNLQLQVIELQARLSKCETDQSDRSDMASSTHNNKIIALNAQIVSRSDRISALRQEISEADVFILISSKMRRFFDLSSKGLRILLNEGFNGFKRESSQYLQHRMKICKTPKDYELWIRNNEPTEEELIKQTEMSRAHRYKPLISIITPVYNTKPQILEDAIESVLEQTYQNWELCLVEGKSSDSQIRETLDKYSSKDTRISVRFLENNLGISENSNLALELAKGEFIALFDHDDLLAPFALHEVVTALNKDNDLDFIYSDMDLIDEKGKQRFHPLFKADWSPEIMYSANYLTHLSIFRRSLIDEVGDFLKETDGAQDWDLFFRITEKTNKIYHISKILYHWRVSDTSCAIEGEKAKPYVVNTQRIAISNHLDRQGLAGDVIRNENGYWRIKWKINDKNKVSIVIPTKDNLKKLNKCLTTILDKTSYENYEIVVIDTGSVLKGVLEYYDSISKNPRIKIYNYDKKFNYSAVNNFGAKKASGEILVFLNDDTEVITSDWLEEMIGWVEQNKIGIVGAKLLKPNGTIQHAGVILGLSGFAGHPFAGAYERTDGPFGSTEWYRDYLAVTGACMMIRKKVFEEIGEFNESFLLNGSDVELCLRARMKGYRIMYTPFANLLHHEAATRGKYVPPEDFITSYKYYEPFIKKTDPYYNPNLSLWCLIPRIKSPNERDTMDFVQEMIKNVSK
jgi:GT2 family glycosyltransferase